MGRTIYLELVPASRIASDLSAGGLFIQDKELAIQDTCTIIVFNDGGQLELPVKAVYLDGNGGVGLEVIGFDPSVRARIDALLVLAAPPEPQPEPVLELPDDVGDATEPLELGVDDPSALDLAPDPGALDLAIEGELAELDLEEAPHGDGAQVATGSSEHELPPPAELESGTDEEREEYKSLHIRLRGLNLAEQIKRARAGDATERMLLERLYGKNVWEPLLRNPRLTAPEVARIARMGALPRTMLEVIFNNSTWLQIPEIRRALLSNPRLGTDQILRVLRLMPKHELKLAAVQTVYPFAVRDAAKRMVKESAT